MGPTFQRTRDHDDVSLDSDGELHLEPVERIGSPSGEHDWVIGGDHAVAACPAGAPMLCRRCGMRGETCAHDVTFLGFGAPVHLDCDGPMGSCPTYVLSPLFESGRRLTEYDESEPLERCCDQELRNLVVLLEVLES